MDALTMVRQDHRRIEELLEQCERLAGNGDRHEFGVLLGQLLAAIQHHIDQDESILYTIFRERAWPPSTGPSSSTA